MIAIADSEQFFAVLILLFSLNTLRNCFKLNFTNVTPGSFFSSYYGYASLSLGLFWFMQVNKPYLPLASGEFSMGMGVAIVVVSAVLVSDLHFGPHLQVLEMG